MFHATEALKNNANICPPDGQQIRRPLYAQTEFQCLHRLVDTESALPRSPGDAYYLAQTWRARGAIPGTVRDFLDDHDFDVADARAIHSRNATCQAGTVAAQTRGRSPQNRKLPPYLPHQQRLRCLAGRTHQRPS
ncbi:hypothetical protein MBLNU13_g10159t1 [Cladosporium sp. NU13]